MLSRFVSLLVALSVSGALGADEKITFEDHVLPIFKNNCLKCHNPDKQRGDLDLSTFAATLKGGGSGKGPSAGDASGSLLYKVITHAEEPFMPPESPKMDEKSIATIKQWIDGGMLENPNSKALTSNKPKIDLTVTASVGKPDGPPPMPGALALDPAVVLPRATALPALASSPWAPVVALAAPKQVVLYHSGDLEYLGVLPYPEGVPGDLKFSRNGKLLLAGGGRGGKSGEVIVWDITTGERIITIGDQYDAVLAADISADQRWIALGGSDRLVKIYDTKDGVLEHKIKKHTDWVTAVEFSPDGKFLVTGDRNGGLMLWEAASGQEMYSLNGHRGAITAVSWRGDSSVVLSASEDGSIKWWNPKDGKEAKSWNAHGPGVLDARFTHDGHIVSAGRDNRVQVWKPDASALRGMNAPGELPNRVTFTHDGKHVVAGDFLGRVQVWSVADGKPTGELEANPPLLATRVERAGKRLAELQSASETAAAKLATAEAAAKVAQDKLEQARQAQKQAQADVVTKEKEIKSLTAEAGKEGAAETVKAQLTDAREAAKKAKADAERLGKSLPDLTKQLESAQKNVAEAKRTAEGADKALAVAKASHARWKAAQQSAPAAKPAKVAAR
jgi:WD40 repeat protein